MAVTMPALLNSYLAVLLLATYFTGAACLGQTQEEDPTEGYWAWQQLGDPQIPAVNNEAWCRNEIDRFILAKLEGAGLPPAPEADRATLIRRATFDLTGLPPTPEEVATFVTDDSAGAWDRLIDRLLNSPHYGERWGRHWLDVVRYAETNGFERDSNKPEVWRYRDWVVSSLNDDKPYDRFLLEQIAGDELPDRTAETVAATGVHRLNIWDDEPIDVEQAIADDVDSILDITVRATLGISIGCARCHDHKGDPISQEDYYRLTAFFKGVKPYRNIGGGTHIATGNILREMPRDSNAEPHDKLFLEFSTAYDTHASALRALEKQANIESQPPTAGLIAHYAFEETEPGAVFDTVGSHNGTIASATLGEAGVLGNGIRFQKNEDHVVIDRSIGDDFTISFFFKSSHRGPGNDRDPRWFQGAGLVDGEISGIVNDFGVSMIGNGIVAAGVGNPEKFISSPPGFNDGKWHHVAFVRSMKTGDFALYVDGIETDSGKGNTRTLGDPPRLTIGRMQPNNGPFKGSIDEVRLYDRVLTPDEIFAMSARISTDPTVARTQLAGAESEYDAQLAALRALRIPHTDMVSLLSVQEDGTTPNATHVLGRGSVHSKAKEVGPGVPRIVEGLAPLPEITPSTHGDSSGRRLAFARWVTDDENAAATRTAVNRIWHHHFGVGIVPTTNDFGRLGLPPSHPELLDWLAAELVVREWSLKSFHKLIMTSSTYRMSSNPTDLALRYDTENRLLSRFRPRRLDAEEIRDSMLSASGELSDHVGGPSVRPPMPKEVLETSSRPDQVWPVSSPSDVDRRSLYIVTKRSLLDPLLTVFDLADPDNSCPERFATTQPTQCLTLLNSDFSNDRARALAKRLQAEFPGNLEQQVRRGLELATSREPAPIDVEDGVELVLDLRETDGMGESAALESFCLIALNLNEFLYVD